MNTTEEINVGVDTGKAQLDFYVRRLDQTLSVPNTVAGIRDALQYLKKVKPTRIVIEATGVAICDCGAKGKAGDLHHQPTAHAALCQRCRPR